MSLVEEEHGCVVRDIKRRRTGSLSSDQEGKDCVGVSMCAWVCECVGVGGMCMCVHVCECGMYVCVHVCGCV